MPQWRVAKSLLRLREQVNEAFPDRSRDSDGTIGDVNHSARLSDHNPDTDAVVKAIDITHDPKNGVDSYLMAEQLRLSRDPRIKYIISNGRICSATVTPWQWRRYNGSNKHNHHMHLSVRKERKFYDDEDDWNLPMLQRGRPLTLADAENTADDDDGGGELMGPPTEDFSARAAGAKSLLRSKISWAQLLAFFGIGTYSSTQADLSTLERIKAFVTSPGVLLVLVMACLGLTIYWRWKDHGRGALQ